MYVSYNWLCEIIPGLNKILPREIAHKLTHAGLEVEEFIDQAAKLKGIVVGEVVTRDKHPNADKLSLCSVRAGEAAFQVVCGAPNVTAGKKYPFATLGTVMPDGLEIKPVKLRGVESFGMLCSAKELQISAEASGLYELPPAAETGAAVADILGLNDTILGLNITPNRGDALSHWGVARDIAALTGLKPDLSRIAPAGAGVEGGLSQVHKAGTLDVKVTVEDAQGCPRYSASVIAGVTIGPSPAWLARRLEAVGLRSINNVVDATNYVMLLTGHPVHAFDATTVRGHVIRVDSLKQARKFKTLDGQERDLAAGDVVIADDEGPIALAGIMGGENSQVRDDTRDLILEVAFFNPDAIRATSRRLGLQTDSSYRFSRFVNPDTIPAAHHILRDLILALAGGSAGKLHDVYPRPYTPRRLVLPAAEITRLLGISVPQADVIRILKGLNCAVEAAGDRYEVTVPIARSDLERPVDLIEEVARVYGMDKIPAAMPQMCVRSSEESDATRHERGIREFFVARGFQETVHYSFGAAAHFAAILKLPAEVLLPLQNPLSEELAVMRPSLLPQLLDAYKKNFLNTDKGLRLFELRKVYRRGSGGQAEERRVLAGLYAGNPWGRNPYGLTRESDFNDGKGLLTAFFTQAGLAPAEAAGAQWPYHSGQCLCFSLDGQNLATLGALHPELIQSLKIREKLYYFEIEYDVLIARYQKSVVRFEPVSPLPPVYRDLALLAPQELTHAEILAAIEAEKPAVLKSIELFDLYTGPSLPPGKKSLAYSFIYQPTTQSLTDEEVNRIHFTLVDNLKKRLAVELR